MAPAGAWPPPGRGPGRHAGSLGALAPLQCLQPLRGTQYATHGGPVAHRVVPVAQAPHQRSRHQRTLHQAVQRLGHHTHLGRVLAASGQIGAVASAGTVVGRQLRRQVRALRGAACEHGQGDQPGTQPRR
ncbi:hypothetical protein [Acidovorax carolinensis]|uniref:hypothetical protein n=1 Tax=Acidovorax carolinensis TaxID=553814 RepID=UPI001F48912C|nr:hypothetical protein [Acidovorax carolinensis]